MKILVPGLAFTILLASCGKVETPKSETPKPTVQRQDFGQTADGTPVDLYTLANEAGMKVSIMTYGGIVTQIHVPDRTGKTADVTLGFDSLEGYLKGHPYFGALIGRYGNRIAKGRFQLNGVEYKLATNNNNLNHLHGGVKGFDKAVWKARPVDARTLELTHTSPDGDEGYPGRLQVQVVYSLAEKANELTINYTATTDKDTVLNLTNHAYFNLAGGGDNLGHVVMLNADRFTPVDAGLIPTGELKPVQGTPFDFTTPHAIGERIDQDDPQLKAGKGYDHNFVLKGPAGALALAARVEEPTSGRVLEVHTTEPGVQFYTGNFLDGSLTGKGGVKIQRRAGFCLETQHFPDSPNQPKFPSTVLKPGQTHRSTTVWKFSAKP